MDGLPPKSAARKPLVQQPVPASPPLPPRAGPLPVTGLPLDVLREVQEGLSTNLWMLALPVSTLGVQSGAWYPQCWAAPHTVWQGLLCTRGPRRAQSSERHALPPTRQELAPFRSFILDAAAQCESGAVERSLREVWRRVRNTSPMCRTGLPSGAGSLRCPNLRAARGLV